MAVTTSSGLTLYAESKWVSPWVFHAMIALEEKALPYRLEVTSLPLQPAVKADLQARAMIATVPVLVHGGHALSESMAISEYLEDVFPAPGHPALLPAEPIGRARARQIMLYLRTSLHALRDARPTSTVFGRPTDKPMPDKAKAEAVELERIALALFEARPRKSPDAEGAEGEPATGSLFGGSWTIADADLALMLMRLVANRDPLDRRLIGYALAQFDRKSVRRFVAHLPTSR